jgi:cobalt-zinc-cadmium efflux system membrane fusion protein
MTKKDYLGIGAILSIGALMGFLILTGGLKSQVRAGHSHHENEAQENSAGHGHSHDAHGPSCSHDHGGQGSAGFAIGPNGGKLMSEDNFALEMLVEDGEGGPALKAFAFDEGKPINPNEIELFVELIGQEEKAARLDFHAEKDHLCGNRPLDDPHSFDCTIVAQWKGKEYRWVHTDGETKLKLTADAASKAGIEVRNAEPAKIRTILELPGEIALNSDRVCHVVPGISGVIKESLKNLGDEVREGDLLAVVDSRELAEAKSRFLVFLKREELALTNFQRMEKLWEKKVSPEKDYLDSLKALEEVKIERLAAGQKLRALGLPEGEVEVLQEGLNGPLMRYEIRAPFNGTVISKHMSKGEWVNEDAEILAIADLSDVWAEIVVYPKHLENVRIGQKAVVRSDASDFEAEGVVSYVGPLVGEESRTSRARVVLPNPGGRWRPGLFVTVQLIREESQVPVAVIPNAIQNIEQRPVVFVRRKDGFEPRTVELGKRDADRIEVLKGLRVWEKYAASNCFVLKAELSKALATCSHTHGL